MGMAHTNDRDMITITEKEFVMNEGKRLEEFAALIKDSGITLYELSKGTRIKYDTLLRALRKKPIRPENEARIRYYINTKNNGDNED